MSAEHPLHPAPRWALTRWLLSSRHAVPSETVGELRGSLFRRMESLLASSVAGVIVIAIAAWRHPTPLFQIWLATDAVLVLARFALVIALMRRRADRPSPPWIVDLFVGAGTLWCAQIGFGTGLCMLAEDPSLGVLASLLAMGTAGALCARNPGAPRVTILHMALIVAPFSIGAWLNAEPLLGLVALLAPLYMIGMISINLQLHADYVELIVARFETRQRSLHCPLTGLPNRAFFAEALRATLQQHNAAGRPVCVLCLDLDGFKAVNDSFGHPAGDALLGQVADRLRSLSGPGRLTARQGGDEFLILLRSGDAADAEDAARALIEAIARPFDLDGIGPATIGVSIGLAMGRDAALLVAQADAALYAAKRAGRGTFRWHWPENAEASGSLRQIARRMRGAYDPPLAAKA